MALQITLALIIGALSIAMLIYAYFTSKEKGPILSNNYLFTTKEDRENIDRKAEYRYVTIIFINLGIILALMTLELLTMWNWLYYIMAIFILILTIYIKTQQLKKY